MSVDPKVTVSREARRVAKILAGLWDCSIKDAIYRALSEAMEREKGEQNGDSGTAERTQGSD
jgi:hypothetical protein